MNIIQHLLRLQEARAWDLDAALDALTPPLRNWIHRPSEGKKELAAAYEDLSSSEKKALAQDVRRAIGATKNVVGATKSGATKSGATKSGATKSGATESGATKSGATEFVAYRRIKQGSEVLKGLDSVTTNFESVRLLDPKLWRKYVIQASDVLVHWGQDTPLGKSGFKHEQEVILKPGIHILPEP